MSLGAGVVARLDRVWDQLDGGRMLITGGSGLYGCWMLETLVAAIDAGRLGARVDVAIRDAAGFAAKAPHLTGHAAVSLIPGDVRDLRPGAPYTHVVHLASVYGKQLGTARPLDVADTLIRGTSAALDVARASGARFLFASSGRIYGPQPEGLANVPETYLGAPDPLAAGEIMSEAKRTAETMVAMAAQHDGLPAVISRGFAFVGPYMPIDSIYALGNFVRDALDGRPIAISGDGTPIRSYMYGSDLAVWLWTQLVAGVPGRAYNTGSEEGLSLRELAERVGAIAGVPVTVAGTPDPARPPQRYVPDTSRARTELGLTMDVDLDDAIRRTLAWHRQRSEGV